MGLARCYCPNQIQPTMDLEVDQRDSGTESKLATRQWASDMFFRLVLAMLVPPALALLAE